MRYNQLGCFSKSIDRITRPTILPAVLNQARSKRPIGQNRWSADFCGKEFIADTQQRLKRSQDIREISRVQRFAGRPSLVKLLPVSTTSDKSIRNRVSKKAYLHYGYTLKEIAEQLDIHYVTVSKVII